MSLDKRALLDFLEEVNKELRRKITIVAVGGTALTLLDTKSSTIDVDFTLPGEDYDEFHRALGIVSHGFKVDFWRDGTVFSQVLPDDYLKRSRTIRTKMTNISLKALSPVDIVVTKIGRLDGKDWQDIEACIKKFGLTRKEIEQRAELVQYVGNEANYNINLQAVLHKFFREPKSRGLHRA